MGVRVGMTDFVEMFEALPAHTFVAGFSMLSISHAIPFGLIFAVLKEGFTSPFYTLHYDYTTN